MASITNDEASLIRNRMQLLRDRLDHRASELATSTGELLDWKTHVGRYPLTLVATGLVSGLLVAPAIRSRSSVSSTSEDDRKDSEQKSSQTEPPQDRQTATTRGGGFMSGLIQDAVLPLVRQFIWNYSRDFAAMQLDALLKGLNSQHGEPADSRKHSNQ